MRRLVERAAKFGQPLRFAIAGAINTVVGVLFYPALLWLVPWLRVHYLVALGVAQVVCLLFAFAIYKLGVFRTHSNLWLEFRTFAAFYVVNYAANWALLPLFVERLHLHPAIAQTIFVIILIIGSYFWHSRLTFRSRQEPS